MLMGAICGVCYLDQNPIHTELAISMMNDLGVYKKDFSDTWIDKSIFFGCCIQHITPESIHEKLPYHDNLSNLVIAADAIIDNREELLERLGRFHGHLEYITDSYLILQAYQKWGKECTKHLIGDFAFAIYDRNSEEIFCAVDHTGNRTLYYYSSSKIFAFSTTIRPLFNIGEIRKRYCDEWICDFLANPSVAHQLDGELTLYKKLLLLPAGHTLTISRSGIRKNAYWKIDRGKELRLKSDKDYEEAFRDVLERAVRSRLRTIRPVGIMLSGGLDSTTVACLAARELSSRCKSLHAFTSIPMEGYHNNLSTRKIADERPYIKALLESFPNIGSTFCSFPGRHPLSDMERFFSILEQPYKILENLFWIDGILEEAKSKGVGVILTGGMGNSTISYGIFKHCILSLLRSGRWPALFKEIMGYSKLKDLTPIKIAVDMLKSLLPYEAQKKLYKIRNKNWDKSLELSPISPEFAALMDQKVRFKKYNFDPYYIKRLNAFEYRGIMLSTASLSHLSTVYTKLGLAHNMVIRDPTIDKRVIEFCMSVPPEQYIRNGRERELLRRAMEGILPDKIRLNYDVRGQQSADFTQRLRPMEKEIVKELMTIGKNGQEKKYLDIDRIHKKAGTLDLSDGKAINDYGVRMLLRSLIFSRFIKGEKMNS